MKRLVMCALLTALVAGACSGDDDPTPEAADGTSFEEVPEDRELVGYRREPAPNVGEVSLPDLTADGADFPLRAGPGNLLLVYFGYTNCPDYCPTTMSDVKLARRRISQPERIELAMVTIDPGRDLPILADYVTSFVPEAHALGSEDPAVLRRAADPLGVTYEVRTSAGGEVEVGHTTALYAIDEHGTLVLTWPFGVTIDDLTADLAQLLNEMAATS